MALDTAPYKARLEEMLKDITKSLEQIGIHNPANPSDWIAIPEDNGNDEADSDLVADRVEDWGERQATLATLETRYNNIVRALQRIDEGTYDTCEVCGKPIEEKRLDANPAARTDIAHREEETHLP